MVSTHIRSRVGEVVIGALLLAMMAYYATFAFMRHNILELWEEWQVALVAFAWLVGVAWGYRFLIGPPHYHPEDDDTWHRKIAAVRFPAVVAGQIMEYREAKGARTLRVAIVDLDTGKTVAMRTATPEEARDLLGLR